MVWEIVFLLLILKIPIVYLCVVVWYAIHEDASPGEPTGVAVVADTPEPDRGSRWTRGRLPRRHGQPGPPRRPGRVPRVATPTSTSRAEARKQ